MDKPMPSQWHIIPCRIKPPMPRLKLGHRMSAAVPNLAPSLSWQFRSDVGLV
jgi:hypothetical protein